MLVAFDFDGTLSDDEMIVLLAERAGCMDAVADITDRAMAGELGYAESLRERAALLEGLPDDEVDAAYDGVCLREGTAELLSALRSAGVATAVLTGGFEAGVERALERGGIAVDHVIANRLVSTDGRLTGEVAGPLVEGTKDEALSALVDRLGGSIGDVAAVGDGANDVPMLEVAGTAVGFRPKSTVRSHCDATVEGMAELRAVLEAHGFL